MLRLVAGKHRELLPGLRAEVRSGAARPDRLAGRVQEPTWTGRGGVPRGNAGWARERAEWDAGATPLGRTRAERGRATEGGSVTAGVSPARPACVGVAATCFPHLLGSRQLLFYLKKTKFSPPAHVPTRPTHKRSDCGRARRFNVGDCNAPTKQRCEFEHRPSENRHNCSDVPCQPNSAASAVQTPRGAFSKAVAQSHCGLLRMPPSNT